LSDEQKKRFAPAHTADGDLVKAWHLGVFAPAGGIRSNVVDMLNYVEAQLGKRKSPLDGAITLSHQRHHSFHFFWGMALGWHIMPDRKTFWHDGQTGGYSSVVAFDTTKDTGLVILTNTATTRDIAGLARQIMRMLAGQDVKPIVFPESVKVDRKVLERYVGVYRMSPSFALTVTLRGDKLYVQATKQIAIALYPESQTRFTFRAVKAAITFETDESGAVIKLILHQDGRDKPAIRVKKAKAGK